MKKFINNLSMRAKIMLISTPLTLALIVSVIIMAVTVETTLTNTKNIYNDKLYNINNALVSADRDFYQALSAATMHYDMVNGFATIPEEARDEILAGQLADFVKNKDQVLTNLDKAVQAASTEASLYRETKSESGDTFEGLATQFKTSYNAWLKLYDVEKHTGDFAKYCEDFNSVRDYLDEMEGITDAWAVAASEKLVGGIQAQIVTISVIFIVVILILFSFEVYAIRLIRVSMQDTKNKLDSLASGDLTINFPADNEIGKDEVGQMVKSAKLLSNKLREVMTTSNDMAIKLSESGTELASSANQASQASEQVTSAVGEIAKGAVSQADNVRNASNNTENIGTNIETIVGNVKEMDSVAGEMKSACDNAMDSLGKLIRQSEDVSSSVKEIGDTINSTNESAKKISEFTQAIMDISAQTNLLSLNASIEAARAGDAGRGFAVVADEIRQLADQSKESADKIKGIVDQLLADSASSVTVLEKLNESFGMQAEQLESTKATMEVMNGNVASVRDTSVSISNRVSSLDDAKNELTSIVSDLSAISEENAASTQETNASMEELNSTFTIITDSAAKLQVLARDMTDTISYFKV
jgi:methyl-accepting chemotaxis protein